MNVSVLMDRYMRMMPFHLEAIAGPQMQPHLALGFLKASSDVFRRREHINLSFYECRDQLVFMNVGINLGERDPPA